jgi:hypothetical protein
MLLNVTQGLGLEQILLNNLMTGTRHKIMELNPVLYNNITCKNKYLTYLEIILKP